jgi:hypothetical protein
MPSFFTSGVSYFFSGMVQGMLRRTGLRSCRGSQEKSKDQTRVEAPARTKLTRQLTQAGSPLVFE